MNFGESVLFAAIMTLIDEIENDKKEEFYADIESPSYADKTVTEISYDAPSVKNKLCKMAQDLFDKADEACQTKTDFSAESIVSSIVNNILFETIDASDADDYIKKSIYQFAVQYCALDSAFPWEFLCTEDGMLAESLGSLANAGMDTVILASSKSKMDNLCVGFIRLMAEFMLYLENAINKKFDAVTLEKRPSVIVLDMALVALRKEMKRLEEEDPTIKEQASQSEDQANLKRLFDSARAELKCDNMGEAAAYYREILKISPNHWEAIFYSAFCEAYRTPYAARAEDIPALTSKIAKCAPNAMRQAKNVLFSRMDIVDALGDITVRVCNLASNYFAAAMNTFRASSGGSVATTSKVLQVSAIIDMMFVVGDSIEEYFGDDFEIVKNISCVCWQIAFDCYENCNMPAPPKMYAHYLKMLEYDPTFRCSKPLTGGNTAGNSGGCYVATAVYGSYDCPQVWTLRRFRDYKLAQNIFGRAFIKFYYATSPTFVRLFKNMKWFNTVFRKLLDKFTRYLIENGYKNTPYTDGINSTEEL